MNGGQFIYIYHAAIAAKMHASQKNAPVDTSGLRLKKDEGERNIRA